MKYKLILFLALLSLLVAVPVNAQWVYEKSFTIDLADYKIDIVRVFEDAGLVIVAASNRSSTTDASVWVLTPDLSVSARYDLINTDKIWDLDYRNGIIAVAGTYGNDTVVVVINHTEGVIMGSITISSVAGTSYAVIPTDIAISGDYIYLIVYDCGDGGLYLYVLDMAPTILDHSNLGSLAFLNGGSVTVIDAFLLLERVENSDYMVFWNVSSRLYIVDGTNGSFSVVASLDLGLNEPIGTTTAAYFDYSENVIYIAYSNSSGTFLVRYPLGAEVSYELKIDTVNRTVSDVSKSLDGIYIVTREGYGYRLTNLSSPTVSVHVEAIPVDAVGYLSGSEHIYAVSPDVTGVVMYMLETTMVITTVTVTQTVTYPLYVTETETVTNVTTLTPPPPGATDLFLLIAFGIMMGSLAFALLRR